VRADDCLVFGASLAGARKRFLAQPLVRYRVHGRNHFRGQKVDHFAVYRRRLAINRLFEHLARQMCFNMACLAELSHREFRTIEKPTIRQLVRYARISMGAPVSMVRRAACVADMVWHFLVTLWQRAPHVATAAQLASGKAKHRFADVERATDAVDASPDLRQNRSVA
jgi:hypothetical protein